ncbi:MAG: ISNCY family transposase [Candidatus Limnocylindrales bacterium]|jgi:transposase|nr:ISNCY family transposase [Candidatus Limnocylindrales bacterium]
MRESVTLNAREQQRSEVVGRWLAGILTTGEAVRLLGCSERTAWRLRAAMLAKGAAGLAHGNRGRPSAHRLPDPVADRIVELATTEYRGFNDTHLGEMLAEEEGVVIARSSLRRLLRARGLASPRRRRAPRYRSRRERMAQEGLMIQVDGSRHDWLEGRGPWLTLVGGIDDATGRIVGAVFREAEDGVGYLTILRDMARRFGLPASIYRDGSSVFAPTHGGARQRDEATQVARALAELGITSIAAGSAQAKGRIERAWGTFQDRLVSELRRRNVTDLAGANGLLRDFIPRFNRRFAVPAASPVPAWRPVPPGLDLARVLAFRWRRAVGSDSTVRLEGALLQLPPGPGGRSLAGRRVEVELRLDGRLLVMADGRLLAAVPAPPEPRRLRELRMLDPQGSPPEPTSRNVGYRPRSDHPWNRPGPRAPSRMALTDSLSR